MSDDVAVVRAEVVLVDIASLRRRHPERADDVDDDQTDD